MFKLLHGKFIIANPMQPDGDTIRFKPDNVDFAPSTTEELKGATVARDELLRMLGFKDATFSGDPRSLSVLAIKKSAGDGSVHSSDGSFVSLDESLVDESVNTTLLCGSYVFPAFYDILPENQRAHLATKSRAARIANNGVWPQSKGFPRDLLIQSNPPDPVRLHDVVKASGNSIELKFWPEDFIIQGQPVNTTGSQP
ncbi:hypothetical protein SNK03_002529 [Fusarium graminearum]